MIVKVEIHFSFPNKRLLKSGSFTNIKEVKKESSINSKYEAHFISENYFANKESVFIKAVKKYLCKYVRRSPSIKKCIFSCEFVPNSKIALRDEFNRKLTAILAALISSEVALMARRRFKNPKGFI